MAPISLESLADSPPSYASPKLDLHEIHDTLVCVAHMAGDMMRSADPSVDSSDTKKNSSDRVTATDKAVEDMIKATVTRRYPDIDFLGEETSKAGQRLGCRPTFVCDPIDGTLNFIHGFPNVAVSLALTVNRKPVVGVVFNPFRGDLFTAIKGRGALLTRSNGNVTRLPVRAMPEPLLGLNDALVALEWGSDRSGPNWELRTKMATKLLTARCAGGAMVHSIRSSGSAALDLCYVAAGSVDLFWEAGCWAWDVCAGWIILEEAGGLIASANPGDWDPTVDGRLYLAVRGAASGQRELVEELWKCMGNEKFSYSK